MNIRGVKCDRKRKRKGKVKLSPVLDRFEGNPILKPIPGNRWESKAVFNHAVIYEAVKPRHHVMKNLKHAVKGVCPKCGVKMVKFG